MKNWESFFLMSFLTIIMLTAVSFLLASKASAKTEVGGTIESSTAWSKSQSPYVVTSQIFIARGVELTIEPGVVVKFDRSTRIVTGMGALHAIGTEAEPIIFTSLRDDSIAGDTNGDGSNTVPRNDDWIGLNLNYDENVHNTVQFAELHYGLRCIDTDGFEIVIANNKVTKCLIGIETTGIFNGRVEENLITNNFSGLQILNVTGGDIYRKNVITDNTKIGVNMHGNIGLDIVLSENEIVRNPIGIRAYVYPDALVENNVIADNTNYGVLNDGPGIIFDARNNDWGHASGPFHPALNPGGQANAVSNEVLFDPWIGKVEPPARNPVIIVPGVPGTELFHGDELIWLDGIKSLSLSDNFLDVLMMDEQGKSISNINAGKVFRRPFITFDYSQGLIDELASMGYQEGTDLFTFPYDWRKDVSNIVEELNTFITNHEGANQKVDIIAHSLGGLVVKKYIQGFGSSQIDKLIFVGSPHLGSPKSAKVLIFGDPMASIPLLNYQEIKKISRNMPSLNQLLPDQKYFETIGGYLKVNGQMLNYNDTKSTLIDDLSLNDYLINQAEAFHSSGIDDLDLSQVKAFNINGCTTATMGSFQVDPDLVHLPTNIQMVPGDGTVPLGSSNHTSVAGANDYFVKKAEHSTMMSFEPIRKLISAILSDFSYSDSRITQDISQCKIKGKLLGIFSPVDVKITDQDSNYSGPNEFSSFTNNIPGATYEVLGGEKFVFLPTDEGQMYQIDLDATDTGTFDLKISDVDGEVQETAYYNQIGINSDSTANFSLSASSNDASIVFDFEGDGTFETLPASSVLSASEGGDEAPPQTTLSASGLIGLNGWYRSNVQVLLAALDDNSGILKTEYSLDSGQTWQIYGSAINLSAEGTTTIEFFSTDRAGNRESLKKQNIHIDTTAPEAGMKFNPNTKDLDISGTDNLSSTIIQISGNTAILTDEAGNTTSVILEKFKGSKLLTAKIKELRYNGNVVPLNSNVLAFGWLLDKTGQIAQLSQSAIVKDDFALTLYYSSKTGQTIIKGLDNGTIISETKPGMLILKIKTKMGQIKYEY